MSVITGSYISSSMSLETAQLTDANSFLQHKHVPSCNSTAKGARVAGPHTGFCFQCWRLPIVGGEYDTVVESWIKPQQFSFTRVVVYPGNLNVPRSLERIFIILKTHHWSSICIAHLNWGTFSDWGCWHLNKCTIDCLYHYVASIYIAIKTLCLKHSR